MKALLRATLKVLVRFLFRIQVHGATEKIQTDRTLVIANHQSFLDGLLLGLFLPVENPVFVVHTSVVRNPFFRLVLMFSDYLAVDPSSPMAMKKVIRMLESGRTIVIFPEGRITRTGSLMKVYDGPAFVAAKTGATVIPVCLDGASRSYFSRLSGKIPRQLFPRISLTFLPPTAFPMPEGKTSKERRRKAGEAMYALMQKMMLTSQPSRTLYSSLCFALEIFGRRYRFLEDIKQVEYSYHDLLKMTLALGRLGSRNTEAGEKIGLLLPNLAPTVGLLFGLSAQGRIPAMLNYTAGVEAMQAACTSACIKRIITSQAFVAQAKLADKLAALQNVEIVYLENLRATMTVWDKAWLMLWGLWFPRRFEVPASPESPAVVLFTSGSEGTPKGVVLSHRALLANIAQIRSVVDFSNQDKVLNALPVFHSFGLTAGTLLPILTGASLFLYPSPLHYRVIPELAYDRGCTVLFGTSTFLGNYAKHAHPYDFYRLRYVIAGAEKLSDTVRNQWFEKFGLRIFEGYGATETAPVLAVNTPMAYRSYTVGQFLPGIEHRLVPVPGIDRGGMLHVRGPNLMSGYLKVSNPGQLETPASELGAGWYETGDIVELDEDGFVKIVGRVKRFAKIAGEMISLEVVEKLAHAASPGFMHAASSRPDASKGEAILLFSADPNLGRDALQNTARELGIPELAIPRKIVYLEKFPLLGTGKIDHVSLKKLAEEA